MHVASTIRITGARRVIFAVGIVVDTVAEADITRRNHPIRIVVDISVRRAIL